MWRHTVWCHVTDIFKVGYNLKMKAVDNVDNDLQYYMASTTLKTMCSGRERMFQVIPFINFSLLILILSVFEAFNSEYTYSSLYALAWMAWCFNGQVCRNFGEAVSVSYRAEMLSPNSHQSVTPQAVSSLTPGSNSCCGFPSGPNYFKFPCQSLFMFRSFGWWEVWLHTICSDEHVALTGTPNTGTCSQKELVSPYKTARCDEPEDVR
jgi:hypothetical protein